MRAVSDQCPDPSPRSHASLVTAGCEAECESPRAARAIGPQQVKGKIGRANASEPSMTPRYPYTTPMATFSVVLGPGAEEREAASILCEMEDWTPQAPGLRGCPTPIMS
ncbi:hypothetical protein GCM10010452_86800 [Crossiella cryophila]